MSNFEADKAPPLVKTIQFRGRARLAATIPSISYGERPRRESPISFRSFSPGRVIPITGGLLLLISQWTPTRRR